MPRVSAGLLVYRRRSGGPEVLLVHPGGPFFRNKDAGAWTIPKGEPGDDEELLAAAVREFAEETGLAVPAGSFAPLPPVKQRGGKVVHAWAVEGELDPATIKSNTFEIEWPPRSGKRATFPEIDRAEFFDFDAARVKMSPAQAPWLDELAALLAR
jgi:predicted NUDIX family NTP pyrophosphohydrolase